MANVKLADYADAKQDIGIENVDNTSDMDKPISTATAAALAGKVGSPTIDTLLEITQAAYDALGTKDPATLYVVTG